MFFKEFSLLLLLTSFALQINIRAFIYQMLFHLLEVHLFLNIALIWALMLLKWTTLILKMMQVLVVIICFKLSQLFLLRFLLLILKPLLLLLFFIHFVLKLLLSLSHPFFGLRFLLWAFLLILPFILSLRLILIRIFWRKLFTLLFY